MEYTELIKMAQKAQKMAYSPYSGFSVGAALLGKSGKIYTGCNVENASYGASNCAERTAFFKAASEGEREFLAIAIVGGEKGEICAPCGICRQVMAEFGKPSEFEVILGKKDGEYHIYKLEELLPLSFGKSSLDN